MRERAAEVELGDSDSLMQDNGSQVVKTTSGSDTNSVAKGSGSLGFFNTLSDTLFPGSNIPYPEIWTTDGCQPHFSEANSGLPAKSSGVHSSWLHSPRKRDCVPSVQSPAGLSQSYNILFSWLYPVLSHLSCWKVRITHSFNFPPRLPFASPECLSAATLLLQGTNENMHWKSAS